MSYSIKGNDSFKQTRLDKPFSSPVKQKKVAPSLQKTINTQKKSVTKKEEALEYFSQAQCKTKNREIKITSKNAIPLFLLNILKINPLENKIFWE